MNDSSQLMASLGLPVNFGSSSKKSKKSTKRKKQKAEIAPNKSNALFISYIYKLDKKDINLTIIIDKNVNQSNFVLINAQPEIYTNLDDLGEALKCLSTELHRKTIFCNRVYLNLIQNDKKAKKRKETKCLNNSENVQIIENAKLLERETKSCNRLLDHFGSDNNIYVKSLEKCGNLDDRQLTNFNKYFHQRYNLFNRFDEGVEMDYVSWYSVTPEFVAKRIAARMACNIVVDGFCGAGGNSIQFASTCDAVYAIDNNENRLRCAKNNAAVYGASNIEFILGDVFAIVPLLIADCVFMSPPWGGPEYSKKLTFDFSDLDSLSGFKILSMAAKSSKNIGILLPRNISHGQILDGCRNFNGWPCEIENFFLGNQHKLCTVYFNDLTKF